MVPVAQETTANTVRLPYSFSRRFSLVAWCEASLEILHVHPLSLSVLQELQRGLNAPFTLRQIDEAETEAFAEWVKASPHDDDKPILLPGEWEVNTRRERQKQGIPLDAGSWQAICDAARQIGMPEETLQAFCQQLAS